MQLFCILKEGSFRRDEKKRERQIQSQKFPHTFGGHILSWWCLCELPPTAFGRSSSVKGQACPLHALALSVYEFPWATVNCLCWLSAPLKHTCPSLLFRFSPTPPPHTHTRLHHNQLFAELTLISPTLLTWLNLFWTIPWCLANKTAWKPLTSRVQIY